MSKRDVKLAALPQEQLHGRDWVAVGASRIGCVAFVYSG
jgi:hypothetical protein